MSYVIVSDLHANAWSLFSKTNSDGVNSRLRIMLNELERAADVLQDEGGDTMVIAGDILHTRGTIDPEVLNPLRDTFASILSRGINIYAIPGNHDLKSAETSELASSIQNLNQISPVGGVFQVFNEPKAVGADDGYLAFVPWRNTQDQLLQDLKDLANKMGSTLGDTDVFIHAGIDGVLFGMPAHGLTHTILGGFGFRRVFAGHYHNHKDFGNGVVSVGATAHHNWGDVGTRAGFLVADDKSFAFHRSNAPHFIDVSGMTEEDMALVVPGNYARFRGPAMTNDDVKELREALHNMGALGTSIEVPRVTNVVRSTHPGKAVTVEQSIENFLTAAPPAHVDPQKVLKRAIEVLHETQAVTA